MLALDCSTAACTAALFDDGGALLGACDEVIGRGHAERLVPMIGELLGGLPPTSVLVGIGPGSFTGLRVALAAAHGMAIGWGADLHGMPSLALLAASAPGDGRVAAAIAGGHGELFVQSFNRLPFAPESDPENMSPAAAAMALAADLAVGSGAQELVDARGHGEALPLLPSARFAMRLPAELRTLSASPLYIRAPDARPKAA
ncbi:MAG: tRNA (adenosine(37)-N6)-threonylcarbamoyltransferase complex dimerization subunit type 1 TsaB [Sphingomicrobium sp.]|nr:tRNA (adenosine(37)-N6)-threonylcarbamoyltransferase complex dimerization subunit type 1 TsaB [Sphingomonadales bacterium]